MRIREIEKHWEYTKHLLEIAGVEVTELHCFLYVQAMLHGVKHGRESEKGK